MEQRLDELGREVAVARQSYDQEKREADAIQALSQTSGTADVERAAGGVEGALTGPEEFVRACGL